MGILDDPESSSSVVSTTREMSGNARFPCRKAPTAISFAALRMVVAPPETFIAVKTFYFIGQLLTGHGDYQQLSGPIGIATVSAKMTVQFGVVRLINLAAVLSVSIGLLNLFPIPMLDGGHILYYGIEAVRGRPLGERAQELGFRIGLALVVSLLLFATWNDLTKLGLFGFLGFHS